ncbi:MAG: hypothetical protein HC902_06225 [Calothrix sp. SM1_5_4]|nr:hypothetical protein [Calothrix sp. SM1_5_4]
MARDLLSLMDLSPGDTLKVGEARLRIIGVIQKDSSQTFRMGNVRREFTYTSAT